MHHDLFEVSPPITLDEFHHYLYWHNRGWGNQSETVEMVVSPLTAVVYEDRAGLARELAAAPHCRCLPAEERSQS